MKRRKQTRKKGLNIDKLLKNNPKNDYINTYRNRYNKGQRKQVKLHIEQMTKIDIDYLSEKIRTINPNSLRVSYHVENKRDNLFTKTFFTNRLIALQSNIDKHIIEYNEIPIMTNRGQETDKRILIRDNSNFNGSHLCFVISLNRNKIVTAYWASENDRHDTLDWNRYKSSTYISI